MTKTKELSNLAVSDTVLVTDLELSAAITSIATLDLSALKIADVIA